jgi:triosephosphate isomerase (TIM)
MDQPTALHLALPVRRLFVGGNWKMNLDLARATELSEDVAVRCALLAERVDVAIYVPFPYLQAAQRALGHHAIFLGGQDLSAQREGAFTGQTSGAMLADLGCRSVLIGHSERRHGLGEESAHLCAKVSRAIESGLIPVLCVGETKAQRLGGSTRAILAEQLVGSLEGVSQASAKELVIAYEPVWAIGTGDTATKADVEDAHRAIREVLADLYSAPFAQATRVIYGGSVNAKNAAELFACEEVDGGLIGGASLKCDDFFAIVSAACS